MCEKSWVVTVTLSDPVIWRSDEYDFKQHQWENDDNAVTVEACKLAVTLLKNDKKSEGFERMLWSMKKLMVLGINFEQFF